MIRPKYIIPQNKPKEKSELIVRYWEKRWLNKRINNTDVLESLKEHVLSYPITHGARVPIVLNAEVDLFSAS